MNQEVTEMHWTARKGRQETNRSPGPSAMPTVMARLPSETARGRSASEELMATVVRITLPMPMDRPNSTSMSRNTKRRPPGTNSTLR